MSPVSPTSTAQVTNKVTDPTKLSILEFIIQDEYILYSLRGKLHYGYNFRSNKHSAPRTDIQDEAGAFPIETVFIDTYDADTPQNNQATSIHFIPFYERNKVIWLYGMFTDIKFTKGGPSTEPFAMSEWTGKFHGYAALHPYDQYTFAGDKSKLSTEDIEFANSLEEHYMVPYVVNVVGNKGKK